LTPWRLSSTASCHATFRLVSHRPPPAHASVLTPHLVDYLCRLVSTIVHFVAFPPPKLFTSFYAGGISIRFFGS
jgi:hypothetical protein